MMKKLEPGRIALAHRETIAFTLGSCASLQVQSGLIWLTIAGDEYDYWLGEGEKMSLPAGLQIVLESDRGMTDLIISLQASAVDADGSVSRPGLFAA